MIQFFDVSKVYANGTVALNRVSFQVAKGEFVFLVGPSGSGKSTVLRLITREEKPTEGKVLINGRNTVRLSRREIPHLRRKIGVVFQDFRLLPKLTVAQNVAFALEVCELPRREIKRRVASTLELVGLADKAGVYPHELSGGEQQRVSIARAVVNNPIVLLADEPTGNLDPEHSWEIVRLLETINLRGTTVLMATHNDAIVNALQRRVIAMAEGCVVRDELRGSYSNEAQNSI
ncbi:MAG: cell division ATP-binding protein FtsE [Firmicutes bacterium]|nr:cell division ATP-binding protein FtsE [Bacillota bacterium]